ncbi:MAG: SUMF1/EgtB/PvdO family nonheme iron enzyme [Limisphaerales bacterium]
MNYFYCLDGQKVLGPVAEAELRQLVAAGRLQWTTPVCPEESETWIAAGELLPILFSARRPPPPRTTAGGAVSKAGPAAARGYRFMGQECYRAAELAEALNGNWAEAKRHWERGLVVAWVKDELRDQERVVKLLDLAEEKELSAEERLAAGLMVLAGDGRLRWQGRDVTGGKELEQLSRTLLAEWEERACGTRRLLEERAWLAVEVPRRREEAVREGLPNATRKQPYENSLGMRFVPVLGTEVLFSVWETRVEDYEVYVKAKGLSREKPSFEQGLTHPAVYVSWEDAQAFAKWLTEKDRKVGRLTKQQSYRLPADWEWSVAVGLIEPRGGTPKDKDGKIEDVYPWRTQWPPPHGAGNYNPSLKVDDYKYTSPVGSFAANQFGMYDLGGNVLEWCEDYYDGQGGNRVLRGGAWDYGNAGYLLSSYRTVGEPGLRYISHGFRLVLVGGQSR